MSGRDNSITELAEEYSFLLKNAGIKKLNTKPWKFKNYNHINNHKSPIWDLYKITLLNKGGKYDK